MLTPKQEKFCLEYARIGNARQAYIAAGYKHDKDKPNITDVNACRLLKNDKVKIRLAEIAKEAEEASIADIQEMQKKLTSIIRQECEEEVIVVEGCGDGYSEAKIMTKKPDIKNVISAIEKLGKMQGAFKDKVEFEVAIPVFTGEDELEE